MTAAMAAIGLMPAAMSHGIGSESQRPLAIVIIGGLIGATFFALFVFPLIVEVVYELSLIHILSRLESMLFSLKKEKNERENELLTLRGELNVLLNLPGDTVIKLSLDEEVLKQLDLSQLSFADLKAMVNERPDLKIARSMVSASRANLKLQKSMAFPEFSVKGSYDRVGNFINDYFAIRCV